jgi:dTDP-4-amino-4,6-dideoxygalactose transaminase
VRNHLIARFHPAELALVDSGTTALALAFRLAAARRPGQPMLLPAWGCYDLATAADAADVPVLLYDLDPATLGPEWDSLERALRAEPAAVVAAHFYGLPVDLARISELIGATGPVLIEDAAQGAGGWVGGRRLGAIGALSVLSFGRGKGMTGGKGGALLANDPAWASQVGRFSFPARRGSASEAVALVAQWALTRPSLYGLPARMPWLGLGETVYHPPHSAGPLTALAAGTLDVTIRLTDQEADQRRAHADWLIESLGASAIRPCAPPAGSRPGWLRLPLRLGGLADPAPADRLVRSLGIYPGYPLSLADLAGFAPRLVAPKEPVPGARELARRLVTLPTHGAVTQRDLERLRAWCLGRQ